MGNGVLEGAKHQQAAAACGPVLILIKYHPAGLDFDTCAVHERAMCEFKHFVFRVMGPGAGERIVSLALVCNCCSCCVRGQNPTSAVTEAAV